MKRCSMCKELFPANLDFFGADKRRRDGLTSRCRVCDKGYQKRYREQNKEKLKTYLHQYYVENSEAIKENVRSRYIIKRSIILRKTRQYRREHADRISAKRRAYYQANKESHKIRISIYAARNPHVRKAAQVKYKARKKAADGSFTGVEWLEKLRSSNGLCYWCGNPIVGKIHADHFIPLSKGGTNDISNIVVSCESCNCSKQDKLPWEFAPDALIP